MSLTPKTGPTASPKFLSPRTQSDGWVTDTVLKSRGWTFDLLEKGLVDKLETPSLVSSAFGHIDHVLLSLPWWVFLAEDEVSEAEWPAIVATANAFVSMLTKLPKSTSFTILVHETAYSQGEDIFIPTERLNVWLAGAGAAARTTVVLAPKTMRFTIWAEDAYAAVTDLSDGESFLVEPASFKRADDALIADIVAGKTEVATTQAKLYFQGGNILIGDDFWLIGLDYPKNSLSLGYVVPSSNETPLEACAKAYGRNLDLKRQFLAIGSRMPVPSQQQRSFTQNGDKWTENLYFGNAPGTAQPLFHIDMFITLAGRNPNGQPVVAVGDPRLAATILGEPEQAHAMSMVFDDIAKQLSELGFEVFRTPLPLTYDDDETKKVRTWYFATSNNALVECTDNTKQIWIPTYGYRKWPELAKTDHATTEIWESRGFVVHQLGDFHAFASNLGAAHCVKKYLKRS